MSTTLQQLYDISYSILREEQSDVSSYPTTLLKPLLNGAELSFCSGNVINPIPLSDTLRDAKKGQLPFLQASYFVQSIKPITLQDPTTIGATTLTVASTTNFPTTGTLYIAGNIIPYTGTTATTFTGCTNILYPHTAGTEVSIIYDMPINYMSSIQLIYNNQFKVPQMLYDDVFETAKDNKYQPFIYTGTQRIMNTSPSYSIVGGNKLLLRNINTSGNMVHMRYDKKPTAMNLTTDICTIDDDTYAQMILPYLAIAEMLYNRGEEDRASKLYNHAIGRCKKAYTYYNNRSYENISGVRVQSDKGNRLNI